MELADGMASLLQARDELSGFAAAFSARVNRPPVNTTKALRVINAMVREAADASDAADDSDLSGVTKKQGAAIAGVTPSPLNIGTGLKLAGGVVAKYGPKAWQWLKSGASKAASWVQRALAPASGAAGAGQTALNLLKKGLAWLALIAGGLALVPPLVTNLVQPALNSLLGAAWPLLLIGAAFFVLSRRKRRRSD